MYNKQSFYERIKKDVEAISAGSLDLIKDLHIRLNRIISLSDEQSFQIIDGDVNKVICIRALLREACEECDYLVQINTKTNQINTEMLSNYLNAILTLKNVHFS